MNTAKVVFLCSRNKDNKGVTGFHERKEVFFAHSNVEKDMERFNAFVKAGLPNEFCRMYVSVNCRNLDKAKKNLMCEMVQNDDFDLTKVETRAVSHAMKPECAAEHHWLFDFDYCGDNAFMLLNEFVKDVFSVSPDNVVEHTATPHGFAVVVDRGFDTRELMGKWDEYVTLKKDDMVCYHWKRKNS